MTDAVFRALQALGGAKPHQISKPLRIRRPHEKPRMSTRAEMVRFFGARRG